jgi:N-acyl-D-aspartate/D-glutamate deacylase
VYSRGVSDVIHAANLLCKQKWTPYDGRRVSFRLDACMVRGTWAYKNGAIQGRPTGRFLAGKAPSNGSATSASSGTKMS